MTATTATDPRPRAVTLVWIDARSARIVRRTNDGATIERLESEVPPRRRSVRHVRRDPTVRHGGGMSQDAGEPHRLEHLTRFVERVATTLPADQDLVIIGPGTVRHVLERQVRDGDAERPSARSITGEKAARQTDPQLMERLLHLTGDPPRRIRPR